MLVQWIVFQKIFLQHLSQYMKSILMKYQEIQPYGTKFRGLGIFITLILWQWSFTLVVHENY